MFAYFIKFYSIFFCLIWLFNKMNLSKITRQYTVHISASFACAILSCIINFCSKELTYFIPLLCFWLIISFISLKPQQCFVSSIIGFGISFSIHSIISFFLTLLSYPLLSVFKTFPYMLLSIVTFIFQILFMNLLLKTKRLSKSLPIITNQSTINIATVACILFVSSSIYVVYARSSFRTQVFAFFSSLFVIAFLIYWWQAQITKAYRRRLELRELESLRTEVTELNLVIARLTEENEKLARITHRDNTLITTLKNSTIKYLSTDFKNPAEAVASRDKLISNINALSAGRTSLSLDSHDRKARRFDTGLPLLDELLGHMDEKAIENDITFSVHLATVLSDFVPKDISESDLVHTVDDLLKNAFKATTTCEKRNVQLQFYKLGKHFVVEVADNGIPFEIKSLVNMGLEKITTYDDGSGIGLVDIWTTKETYGATYHLDEYMSHPSFTKKISLTFDKKNLYSIRTWRKDEILQVSKRTDLQVYDYSE